MKLSDIVITEASYPGNIGAMEVFQFYKQATPEEKERFDHYLQTDNYDEAWELIQDVTGVRLHPMGERYEVVTNPVISITVKNKSGDLKELPVLKHKVERDNKYESYYVDTPAGKVWVRVSIADEKVYHIDDDKHVHFIGYLVDTEKAKSVA